MKLKRIQPLTNTDKRKTTYVSASGLAIYFVASEFFLFTTQMIVDKYCVIAMHMYLLMDTNDVHTHAPRTRTCEVLHIIHHSLPNIRQKIIGFFDLNKFVFACLRYTRQPISSKIIRLLETDKRYVQICIVQYGNAR